MIHGNGRRFVFMSLYRIWRWGFIGQGAAKGFDRVAGFVPPVFVNLIKHLLSEWEYNPQGWRAASSEIEGWNHQSVAQAQEGHWHTLVNNLKGPGPLGVSHFPWKTTREDRADHNAMMSFGYVLLRASRGKSAVSVLDWGGGVGHYYLYSKALLPGVEIDYHCYDVPNLCRVGRTLLPEVHFHDDAADLAGRQFDLVITSSSLHYFEDWREIARKLAAATGEFLYVARLQTVARSESFVVVQRPYRAGYHTEYPSWFLNRRELIACFGQSGMDLEREFVFAEDWYVRGAPEKGDCRGFLFRRSASGSDAH
jgi:putative methyltransferase (TIGR04325 family)